MGCIQGVFIRNSAKSLLQVSGCLYFLFFFFFFIYSSVALLPHQYFRFCLVLDGLDTIQRQQVKMPVLSFTWLLKGQNGKQE